MGLIKAERIVDLVREEIEAMPCYIAPAILPVGGQLVFGGRAKVGKSFMMMEFARALASGDPVFGYSGFTTPQPCRVLLIEQELGKIGLQQRAVPIWTEEEIERLGRRADNLWYVSKIPELRLDTPAGRKILYELCDDVKPNVLILDPIARMHGYNENEAKEVSTLFRHLDELQKANEDQGMALIFSHHMGKPKSKLEGMDPLDPYEFRGSSKFFDNPDSLITLERCANISKGTHKAWSLKVRFTLRHGEAPDDMIFHVNEQNDGRVRYYKTLEENRSGSLGGARREAEARAAADIAANPSAYVPKRLPMSGVR